MALRLAAVVASPLQLYPDEAQYWVWSRDLAFGYLSKPPMIAWLIRLTTAFGDSETFVRLSSPLLQAATGLFVYAAGWRLYGGRAALAGLLIYTLAPGVQLGAFVMATDTPLLAFLAMALWLYVTVRQTEGRTRIVAAAGLGLALGLAFLSKYAALYALIGIAAHLAISREARRAWTFSAAAAAVAALALTISPNLAWNAAHGFATVTHIGFNAGWDHSRLFQPIRAPVFLADQLAVFGPGPFVLLTVGGVWMAVRRRLTAPDTLLLCWAVPPLAIITVQAFVAQANANWAAAAYAPAAVLVGAWLIRWNARRTAAATYAVHGLAAAIFLLAVIQPNLVDRVGASNAIKRVRGWREVTDLVEARATAEAAVRPLTATTTDDRFLFDEMAYYGRDFFGRGGPPLRVWTRGTESFDQAARDHGLTADQARRALAVTLVGDAARSVMGGFARTENPQIASVILDRRHTESVELFLGEGLR